MNCVEPEAKSLGTEIGMVETEPSLEVQVISRVFGAEVDVTVSSIVAVEPDTLPLRVSSLVN